MVARYEQDRVITRLQQRVNRNSVIRLCLLLGSYGRRNADDYANLNVLLAYGTQSDRDAAWQARAEFASSILPYVTARSIDSTRTPLTQHILFGNGTLALVAYRTLDEAAAETMGQEIRVLKQPPAGWDAIPGMQSSPPPAAITGKRLQQIDDQFWVNFWDIQRQLARGDHDRPFATYLELLHNVVRPLLPLLPSEHPARQAVFDVRYTRNSKANQQELRRLLDAYLQLRGAIVTQYRLAFTPDSGFESGLKRLLG